MSEQNESRPSFFVRLVRFVVRFILVLVVGVAIGAGLYFGFVRFYNRFVQPLQEHESRLDALEAYNDEVGKVTRVQLNDLEARFSLMETFADNQKETLADMGMRLTRLETSMAVMEDAFTSQNQAFSDVQSAQQDADTAIAALEKDLNALQGNVDDLQTALDDLSAAREADKEVLSALLESSAGNDARLEALKQEMEVLNTLELLTRSRLYLSQGNLTLARSDIQAARERLAALTEEGSPAQAEVLNQVLDLLDNALESLPRFPIRAADKVEGAWDLLINGLPGVEQAVVKGGESEPIETPTPTPTP